MAQILLIRHGQASWGKRNYDELSPRGVEQARVLGQALKQRNIQPDRIITGAMTRHKQTAMACLDAMGLPHDWDEDRRWNEYDHQELIVRHKPLYRSRTVMMADLARTLRPREAFQEMFEQALDRWLEKGHSREYRETWPMFATRVGAALDTLAVTPAATTLVFTSGGAISATVARLWNMPDSEWKKLNRVIANATVTKVVVGRNGTHLSSFNEHTHFEGDNRHLLSYR
ncbi:MAG: histidine phosphatase family protein [Alcanivoracaceae bacterium]|jgi:broad specificity phosphatase PhoE